MTGLKRTPRSRGGFTLVELIVVLVILGVLATFAVPALTGYIDSAKEKQAVSEALTELWANPSSLYDPAVAVQDAIAAARARVAKTLHCRSDEIYFTACGSEGNNMAVTGAARPRKHWGNKIVVTGFEHPSVQRPIRALKDEGFTVVEVMPGADGRIDTQKFLAEIDKNTVLAVWMAQSFLDPISSIAPTAYIVWQNFVNSYQIWKKDKESRIN